MPKNKPSTNSDVGKDKLNTSANTTGEVFRFFTEVGIISQLATAILAQCLPDGVHPSHFSIMNHLCRLGDGRSPISIAEAMQVTKTTMSHSLKVLEKKGFITLMPNPEDARGKQVYLTDKGRKFRAEAIKQASQTMGSILTDEHVKQMQAMLPELAEVRMLLDKNRP